MDRYEQMRSSATIIPIVWLLIPLSRDVWGGDGFEAGYVVFHFLYALLTSGMALIMCTSNLTTPCARHMCGARCKCACGWALGC